MFTVGYRHREDESWLHTLKFETEERAEAQKEEWERNSENAELEFCIIELAE